MKLVSSRPDFTFKHNVKLGRHGWLRLTPAYSVKVVEDILNQFEFGPAQLVLDPFAGTGTTGLVCAGRGLNCDLVELNPFLVWLSTVKTRNYEPSQLDAALELAHGSASEAGRERGEPNLWVPPISNIERWWNRQRLETLARLFATLTRRSKDVDSGARDLVLIGFCRTAIDWSNAAFNHQSMSFKDSTNALFTQDEPEQILRHFLGQIQNTVQAARADSRFSGNVRVLRGDSRALPETVPASYDLVITSPPYPNRISYIRELRPYMYWLGYLTDARQAADLDWQAIGGTWGVATSRLLQWRPNGVRINYRPFEAILKGISDGSRLLANYVHKYFADMAQHFFALPQILTQGAKVFYVVGNTKFYRTVVPVEEIYVALMEQAGFKNVGTKVLRKRNSKKELYEYIVMAEWPGRDDRLSTSLGTTLEGED